MLGAKPEPPLNVTSFVIAEYDAAGPVGAVIVKASHELVTPLLLASPE